MTDHIIKAAKEAGFDWTDLGVQDRLAFARFYAIAYRAGMERAAEICESIAREDYGMTDLHEYGECAEAIRAHAQNQPKTTHDGSVV